MSDPVPVPPQPPKARRGCLFYGCLVGLVLLLLVVAGGLLGLHYAKKMFNNFTEAAPATLPTVSMSSEQIGQIRKRVDDFRDSVRAGKQTDPLVLTSDEINALISTDPDMQPLKNKFYVSMEGDKIKGQLSVPMDQLVPIFKGRYLNGSGTFNLTLKNGILRLMAEEIVVKGNPLPDNYMKEIRNQNLAKNLNSDPRVSVALDKLKSIEVKDGKLEIVPLEPGTSP